jgi:thioredoxin reductase (NADPH)
MDNKRDIVIVGAGPAGISAAIYSARSGMETSIIEKSQPGGQLWWSESIENYPGFPDGISSMILAGDMEKQARKFAVEFVRDEAVGLKKVKNGFEISTASGADIHAVSVIIASGASMSTLGIKGEKDFTGKGVSYCAVCDGPLFRDKPIAVIGGGNTACEEAAYLAKFASIVYLIHRRPRLRAVKTLVERINNNPKIKMVLEKKVQEIAGGDTVESLRLDDDSSLQVNGVFIFAGLIPSTGIFEGFLKMENGFVVTNDRYMTSVEGVFAAGDCRHGAFRQVITACGEGACAGEESRKFVEKKKGTAYDW